MIYIVLFILAIIATTVFIIRTFGAIIKFFNWLYPFVVIGTLSVLLFMYVSSLESGDITNIINSIGDYIVSFM